MKNSFLLLWTVVWGRDSLASGSLCCHPVSYGAGGLSRRVSGFVSEEVVTRAVFWLRRDAWRDRLVTVAGVWWLETVPGWPRRALPPLT